MEFDLICINCIHYNRKSKTCKAFENGIPLEIWQGLNDHSEPLAYQENDIVFTPTPPEYNATT
jgi:hypothetical protein